MASPVRPLRFVPHANQGLRIVGAIGIRMAVPRVARRAVQPVTIIRFVTAASRPQIALVIVRVRVAIAPVLVPRRPQHVRLTAVQRCVPQQRETTIRAVIPCATALPVPVGVIMTPVAAQRIVTIQITNVRRIHS